MKTHKNNKKKKLSNTVVIYLTNSNIKTSNFSSFQVFSHRLLINLTKKLIRPKQDNLILLRLVPTFFIYDSRIWGPQIIFFF